MAPAEPCARTFVRSRLGTLRSGTSLRPCPRPVRDAADPRARDLPHTITDASAESAFRKRPCSGAAGTATALGRSPGPERRRPSDCCVSNRSWSFRGGFRPVAKRPRARAELLPARYSGRVRRKIPGLRMCKRRGARSASIDSWLASTAAEAVDDYGGDLTRSV